MDLPPHVREGGAAIVSVRIEGYAALTPVTKVFTSFDSCSACFDETVQNLGVITPHFETDGVPTAPRRRNPC
jgi:hypothetical protein